MKNIRLNIMLKLLMLVVVSILVGTVLMFGVYSLPNQRLLNNLKDSTSLFKREENRFETWTGTWARYAQIDNATDSLMINTAICREHGNIIEDALLNPHYEIKRDVSNERGTVDISLFLQESNRNGYTDYSRYWHGYLVFLIPGLIVYNVGSFRTIMLTIQFFLMLVLLYKLSKIDFIYSFIYGLTIIFINPITTALNIQNASVYTLCLLFSIIILYFNDYLRKNGRYYLLFAFIGILTAFIDLLTYPILSYGIPVMTYLIINNDDYKKSTLDLVLFGFSWIFGYAGMWLGKWGMATLFTDTNTFADAFETIKFRSGQVDIVGQDISVSRVLFTIYKEFNYIETLTILLFGIVFVVVYSLRNKKEEVISLKAILPYCVVFLSGLVWAIALKQHFITHQFLEYRTMAIFVLAFFVIMYKLLAYKKD